MSWPRQRGIFEAGDSHDLAQGVAKNDGYTSRASALAEDEPLDKFYRPASNSSKLRSGSTSSTDRPLPADEVEPGEEESFLRSRRRVQVRKGFLPKNRIARIALFFGMAVGLALLTMLGIAVHDFLKHDPRFRIESASAIQILGNSEVTRPELLAVFGSDIGRNVFFVPLDERRAELEQLPWVEHATLMRLLPNQLRISIVERTPVAFVRRDKEIGLVDANGVLLEHDAGADGRAPLFVSGGCRHRADVIRSLRGRRA